MERKNVKLIKIDRNGSKHYEGMVECDRCNGRGLYVVGILNGEPEYSHIDSGICWKCHGERFVPSKWIERTPEYQAKLDARREAKYAAKRAEQEAKQKQHQAEWEAEQEAKRKAKEEAERIEAERKAAEEARKAISKHYGEIGQRVKLNLTYVGSAHFEIHVGWSTQTMYIHNFLDESGNKFVWKSTCYVGIDDGESAQVTGTIKDHSEYKGEKQTVLTRCKIVEK